MRNITFFRDGIVRYVTLVYRISSSSVSSCIRTKIALEIRARSAHLFARDTRSSSHHFVVKFANVVVVDAVLVTPEIGQTLSVWWVRPAKVRFHDGWLVLGSISWSFIVLVLPVIIHSLK